MTDWNELIADVVAGNWKDPTTGKTATVPFEVIRIEEDLDGGEPDRAVAGPVAIADAYRRIEAIAHDVDRPQRGGELQIDVGMEKPSLVASLCLRLRAFGEHMTLLHEFGPTTQQRCDADADHGSWCDPRQPGHVEPARFDKDRAARAIART